MLRHYLLYLTFLFPVFSAFAQEIECVINAPMSLISVETAPIIEECDELKDTKECFKKKLQDYLQRNMRNSSASKIVDSAHFFLTVSKDGSIADVQVWGKNKIQKEELEKLLPLLKVKYPATLKGEKVSMQYFSAFHREQ